MIEGSAPLLTIFVPTIELSKFSPGTWDSDSSVPLVATNYMKKDFTIPVFEDGKEILFLKTNEVPGFPVLVVKSNERIKLKNNVNVARSSLTKAQTNNNLHAGSFEFISPEFSNVKQKK